MFALSWQLTLAALLVVPVFLWSARQVGRKLRVLTRESYDRAAEMNNLMVERFNVAGAMVSKIFGRPEEEAASLCPREAGRVREIGMKTSTYARLLFIGLGLMASLALRRGVWVGWGAGCPWTFGCRHRRRAHFLSDTSLWPAHRTFQFAG